MEPTALLRAGLLRGRVVALGGGSALGPPLAALGALTAALEPTADERVAASHVRAAIAAHGAIDVLVHDLRPQHAAALAAGEDALRAALDPAWATIRAVAHAAWIDRRRPGRVTLIAPPPGGADRASGAAGRPAPDGAPDPAAAVRAAAENLARTLSIEWARHGIRAVAVAPGATTPDPRLAAVAAYLASPAGDYASGCVLALDELAPARPPG